MWLPELSWESIFLAGCHAPRSCCKVKSLVTEGSKKGFETGRELWLRPSTVLLQGLKRCRVRSVNFNRLFHLAHISHLSSPLKHYLPKKTAGLLLGSNNIGSCGQDVDSRGN
jgi:hypothetical protein